MRRIEVEADSSESVNNRCTIEHYSPQNPTGTSERTDALDYNNMLAVCGGFITGEQNIAAQTCDRQRGNRPLTIDPRSRVSMAQIKYSNSGKLFSDQQGAQDDIDHILNLNSTLLVRNRREAWLGVIKRMQEKHGRLGTWNKEDFRRLYNDLAGRNRKLEYSGFIFWLLEKRL